MTVEVLARAKLTLSLRVLGARADGFHDLEALTVSVHEPHDVLVFDPSGDRIELQVTGGADSFPVDATNLVARAARAIVPDGCGARISLAKRIPVGAGLGGGSADAAVTLTTLGHEWGVPEARVHEVAARLGSDVPFCLRGEPAWMRGRGEHIEPVGRIEPVPVMIAVPPFPLATPDVYRAWDELGGPHAERRVPPPRPVAHLLDALVNDLEPAAERVEPRITDFRAAVEARSGRPVVLAGSGSAYAACFDDVDDARDAVVRVRRELGVEVFLSTTR